MPSPKLWLIFVIGLVLIAWSIQYAFSAETDKMNKEMLSPAVQINDNCSGTLIHSSRDDTSGDVTTYVLTAKHCLDGNKDHAVDIPVYQKMRIVKKERYLARVKARDRNPDLGLLVLKDRQTFFDSPVKLASADLEIPIGESVWTVGYPLGGTLTVTNGLFGATQTLNWPRDGVEYFRATPNATFGNSGGALFYKSDNGYEQIGVVTARTMDNTFMTLYTPIADIEAFLKRVDPEAFGGKKKSTGPSSR